MSRSSELLTTARELIATRLSDASSAHCERVASESVKLAARFGVDLADAELAGLLHDYARDCSDADLIQLAGQLGVPVSTFEDAHTYLLHARVGAAMVRRDLPGVGENILAAIRAHTVGAVPMSDLDRVVYLADMIEPARAYSGVEELRAACATESLAECFRRGYARSLRYIVEKGKLAHPISAAVADAIEAETGRSLFEEAAVAEATAEEAPEHAAESENTESGIGEVEGEGDAAGADEEAGGEPDETRRVRRVRRRRAGRSRHAEGPRSTADDLAQAVEHASDDARPRVHAKAATSVARVARSAVAIVVTIVLVLASLAGLVVGVNAVARWWAIRQAGPQVPTSDTENNLLVIGVDDGIAIGFTALKMERLNGRVLGIAIPDGAFVEVPGQGFERIGASFITGADVSKDTVSNYLGVSFPRYIVVDGPTYQNLLSSQDVAGLMDRVSDTDLSEDERASFTEYLASVSATKVWIAPLPVKPVSVGDQQYYEPQRDKVADLLLQWWGVKASAQRATPRVIVYNGVGTPGLAGQAAQQLIRTGFRIVNSGNADNFDYPKTVIYLYHGTQSDAQAVRDALGVGDIVVQSAPQELTDMIVIIGADYKPPVDAGSVIPTEGAQ